MRNCIEPTRRSSQGSGLRTWRALPLFAGFLAGAAAGWSARRNHDASKRDVLELPSRHAVFGSIGSRVPPTLEAAQLLDLTGDSESTWRPRIRWIRMLLLLAVGLFIVLFYWQTTLPHFSRSAVTQCMLDTPAIGPPSCACETVLSALIGSVPPADSALCSVQGPASQWFWEEPKMPRLWIWVDNLLVDVYTALFVAVAAASWHSRGGGRAHGLTGRVMLHLTWLACVAGAVADHAENFWLLAHIGTPATGYSDELAGVAWLSLWKMRLFVLNALVAGGWLMAGRTRQMWRNPDF